MNSAAEKFSVLRSVLAVLCVFLRASYAVGGNIFKREKLGMNLEFQSERERERERENGIIELPPGQH